MSGPAIPDFPTAEFTRSSVPKKKGRRGGKGKGSSQASQHLEALKSAHGAGDFASARTHAGNYMKASLSMAPSTKAPTQSFALGAATNAADPMDDSPDQTTAPSQAAQARQTDPQTARARLAAIAIKRKAMP